MHTAFEISRSLSIIAFLFFGTACFASERMVAEFERYGLARFRRLVGALEVLGALGLLAGYLYHPLLLVSAGGLSLLMFLGVLTRIRVRDSFLDALPAAALCAMNGFVLTIGLTGD